MVFGGERGVVVKRHFFFKQEEITDVGMPMGMI